MTGEASRSKLAVSCPSLVAFHNHVIYLWYLVDSY